MTFETPSAALESAKEHAGLTVLGVGATAFTYGAASTASSFLTFFSTVGLVLLTSYFGYRAISDYRAAARATTAPSASPERSSSTPAPESREPKL